MKRQSFVLLFLLGATVFNLILAGLFFALILVLYGLGPGRLLRLQSAAPVILVGLALALLGAGFVYRRLLGKARKRWKIDEKLGFKEVGKEEKH